jgi:hypothetical protein
VSGVGVHRRVLLDETASARLAIWASRWNERLERRQDAPLLGNTVSGVTTGVLREELGDHKQKLIDDDSDDGILAKVLRGEQEVDASPSTGYRPPNKAAPTTICWGTTPCGSSTTATEPPNYMRHRRQVHSR